MDAEDPGVARKRAWLQARLDDTQTIYAQRIGQRYIRLALIGTIPLDEALMRYAEELESKLAPFVSRRTSEPPPHPPLVVKPKP